MPKKVSKLDFFPKLLMFQSDYWKHNEVYNWNKSNKVHQGTANDFHQDNSVVNRISQRFLPAASYNFRS
jgi:hypothetical protein